MATSLLPDGILVLLFWSYSASLQNFQFPFKLFNSPKLKKMKKIRLFATLSIASVALLISSCNSGLDREKKEATADTTMKKAEMTTAPSGPLSLMVIRHKVANYEKWKTAYEAHDSARLANGLHKYVICRGLEDSNMVLVAQVMDDVSKAKEMAASPGLKEVMKKAGVTGPPMIDFITGIMNDTTYLQETVRIMVRHKVKDWDAWKKAFDSHKQMRMDAGLTDRVIGYSVGDNHQVTLVFATADLDKAKAFMNSQELKDKMKEAGVEGAPDRFMYRVVQRY